MVEREPPTVATITVIAGTNGAGKSSILGEYLRQQGGEYFNPDEIARRLRENEAGLRQADANALAWTAGRDLLANAIDHGLDFVFETTLGGNTIPRLLADAASRGHHVSIWYVGLDSPETHIRRVEARVRRGGHPIAESKIRERFTRSVENLIALLPMLHECRVFDNSYAAELDQGEAPRPASLLHLRNGEILESVALHKVPEWAKPIFAAHLIERR
ncbi:MAG: zeta toxin family protein [Wenzhouxiangellaceae bacterium]|nr:zeta toxin family protein [Wenzhouxiangellaceae bacterium]